jgi:hypothetical protein
MARDRIRRLKTNKEASANAGIAIKNIDEDMNTPFRPRPFIDRFRLTLL